MNYKNYSIFAAVIVAVVGISVFSFSNTETQIESDVIPEPKSKGLASYGEVQSLAEAKRNNAFAIVSAKAPIDNLPLQSVKTKTDSVNLFYGPNIDENTTRNSYLNNGGLIILNQQSTPEQNESELNSLIEQGGDFVSIVVQGHPTYAFEDGRESQLRIFPTTGDNKITMMYGGSLEQLLEISEKIDLS